MNARHGFPVRSVTWLITGLWSLCRVLLITWATFAVYYSNLPWPWLRLVLAGAFAAFAIWALFLSRQRWTSLAAIGLFLGVVAWWMSIAPSHDRNWRPEVACRAVSLAYGEARRLLWFHTKNAEVLGQAVSRGVVFKVLAGGEASAVTVNSGGTEIVAGGTAGETVGSSGGALVVSSGGTADPATIFEGGTLNAPCQLLLRERLYFRLVENERLR